MNKVFITLIREMYSDAEIDWLMAKLPVNRIQTLKKKKFQKAILQSLLGEVMLRIQVSEKMGQEPGKIRIDRDVNGKPYLVDYLNCHFSISHSGNWIVCLLADQNCGIDIEKMLDEKIEIADRFFTNRENELIRSVAPEKRKEVFYELWTLKESYMKYDGRGLSIGIQNVEFEFYNGEYHLVSDIDNKIYFKQLEMIDGYKISICTLDPEYDVHILPDLTSTFVNN